MSHFLTMIIWGKMDRELDSCFIGKNIYIDIRKPAQVHRTRT